MTKKLSIPSVRSSAIEQQEVFSQASDPLTRLETIDLGIADLEELGTVVKEAHKAFESHLVSALQAALIAGRALLAANTQFGYDRNVGGFRGWVADLGLSKSASYRYMDLARHDEIVSQAGTLSEAMTLLSQYKAKERATKGEIERLNTRKVRATLTLSLDKDAKLKQIATERGIDVSTLITEVIDRWLNRQKAQSRMDNLDEEQ